jgi:signal transduction histidine kinase
MLTFSKIALIPSAGLVAGLLVFGAGDLRADETDEGGIAARVARVVSPEMRRIEARLGELDDLPQLLAAPLAERYGYRSATLYDQEKPQWVQLDLGRQQKIDRIVAVPTHIPKFGKKGEGYGFPLRFRIEVANNPEMERAVTVVDRTAEDVENPGRYPMVFRIDPLEGRYVRFVSTRHAPVEDGFTEGFMWALEELMVLSGNKVLSGWMGLPREEVPEASSNLDFYPHWALARVTDSQSSLGLPVSTEESPSLGYLSASTELPKSPKWVVVDFGREYPIDEIRLVAVESEEPEVEGGRAWPMAMVVELSSDPTFPGEGWRRARGRDPVPLLGVPGGCAVRLLPSGYRARYLRILSKKPWRHRKGQHAFALAEVQAYSGGENVALGKAVQASDVTDRPDASGWAPEFVVDGFSSRHRLIEYPEYLALIERRGELEREQVSLILQRDRKVRVTGQVLNYGGGTIGVVALLGWAWMLVRQRTVKRRAVVQLRDQIARDLHDDIGCNLGGIVLLSDIGSQSSGEGQAREDFETIRETAEETSQSMKDIVWLIRHGNTELRDLVTRMRRATEVILGDETVSLSVEPAEYRNRKVSLLFRRHVFFAFKEALNNVRKHAGATSVEVNITIDDRDLSFEVRDDGRGFDQQEIAVPGNGLKNITERAERLKGTCRVESTPGKGTCIAFTSPLNSDLK